MWQNNYHSMIATILHSGEQRPSRAGATKSIFGQLLAIEPWEFPLLETRKIFYRGVLGELAAMLRGANTVEEFKKYGCNYWDNWADDEGKLELDYGTAWRNFNGVDQLVELIDGLKANPVGRRHIITGWRPDRLAKVSLPCCHLLYQWYISNDGRLDMLWYQRSVDVMVGLPSDVLFAVVWNMLVAQTTGYKPGKVTMVLGDTHVYANHFDGANKLLESWRAPKHRTVVKAEQPRIELNPKATVFNFVPNDILVTNYNPETVIKFELNV